MDELTDKIEMLAAYTDEFCGEMIEATGNPLVATTVILSRLVLINDEVGTGAEFRLLLKEVAEKHYAKQREVH